MEIFIKDKVIFKHLALIFSKLGSAIKSELVLIHSREI
jgi:DNA-binding CsgD family transcriptional regulator